MGCRKGSVGRRRKGREVGGYSEELSAANSASIGSAESVIDSCWLGRPNLSSVEKDDEG